MKEISKYLIEFIQKDFLSKNKDHWNSQIPEFSTSTENFLLSFYNKCSDIENLWKIEKQNIRCTPIDLLKEYDVGKHYDLIPEKIRDVIENQPKVGFYYEFSLYEQIVKVSVVYPYAKYDPVKKISLKKQKKYFEECIHRIYLWLSIIYPLKKKYCSQYLSIYLYLTDQAKEIPDSLSSSTKTPLDIEHINTAFTFACRKENEIHLYREEEWFKVFIHESFHSLGLDFAYSTSLTQRSDTQILQLFSQLPTSTDIRSYETYCEMNAEIWNLVLYSFFTKKNPKAFLEKVRLFLWYEKVYSVFQCVKVLHTMDLSYLDLYSNKTDSIPRIKSYKERTYLFSYYVLKSICMTYNTDFIQWLEKQNNGSIMFLATQANVDSFVKFIREHYQDPVYLKNISIIEEWFSQYHSRDVLENETLKMNIVEF